METNFKKVVREDNNGVKRVEYQFGAELTGINTNSPQSYENAAGETKQYYLGTINFTAPNGVEQKGATTQIHAKSFEHGMKIGDVLLSTLTKDENGNLWVRTSHLLAVSTLDVAAFADLSFDEIEDTVDAAAQPSAVTATA